MLLKVISCTSRQFQQNIPFNWLIKRKDHNRWNGMNTCLFTRFKAFNLAVNQINFNWCVFYDEPSICNWKGAMNEEQTIQIAHKMIYLLHRSSMYANIFKWIRPHYFGIHKPWHSHSINIFQNIVHSIRTLLYTHWAQNKTEKFSECYEVTEIDECILFWWLIFQPLMKTSHLQRKFVIMSLFCTFAIN